MKRGLSGQTRRGGPPLSRQRIALRAIQLTLIGVALVLWWFGWMALQDLGAAASDGPAFDPQPPSVSDVVALAAGGAAALAIAAFMGIRAVRGPRPPEI